MAKGWKRWAEIGLARGGSAALALRGRRSDVAILAYHNIIPTGETLVGDQSLHIDQAVFAAQLDLVRRHADVVALSKIHLPPSGSRLRVAITFDDAYRGTMTAGLAELDKRGLPATVFVPTGLMGGAGFWWDRLTFPGLPLDLAARDHVLRTLQGDGDRAVSWAEEASRTLMELPDHAKPVNEQELLACDMPGLSLGAHTVTHANLPTLSEIAVLRELTESKQWLQSRTDRYVDWLAYPYGYHDDAVVRVASDVFDGALRVDGGLFRSGSDTNPHRVPRINVPRGLSLDGLLLRLSGLIT